MWLRTTVYSLEKKRGATEGAASWSSWARRPHPPRTSNRRGPPLAPGLVARTTRSSGPPRPRCSRTMAQPSRSNLRYLRRHTVDLSRRQPRMRTTRRWRSTLTFTPRCGLVRCVPNPLTCASRLYLIFGIFYCALNRHAPRVFRGVAREHRTAIHVTGSPSFAPAFTLTDLVEPPLPLGCR